MIDRYAPFTTRWDPFSDISQLSRTMNRLFRTFPEGRAETFPAMNVYAGDEEAVVTAELPGVESNQLDVSVNGDIFTISGTRETGESRENQAWHRRERFSGKFTRSVQLPFQVESDKVRARLKQGVLQVILPRAEADKPRRIQIENK